MNRKGDETTQRMLYEIIGLVIFGFVALIWFGGMQLLIGGSSENYALKNFNNFLKPISEVCQNKSINASSLATGLDINVYGTTFIVTQIRVPNTFMNDPKDAGMLPVQMRRCIDSNCLCLLELNEFEGNWQLCTTAEWDLATVEYGFAPGCPFWYYAPPDFIEQAITNMWAITNVVSEIGTNLILGWVGQEDRDYFTYPAPEVWGGCKGAGGDNVTLSTFSGDHGSFNCSLLSNDLNFALDEYAGYSSVSDLASALTSDITSFEANFNLPDYINDSIYAEWTNKSVTEVNIAIMSAMKEPFNNLIDNFRSSVSPIIDTSFSNAYVAVKSAFENILNESLGLTIEEAGPVAESIINNLNSSRDRVLEPGEFKSFTGAEIELSSGSTFSDTFSVEALNSIIGTAELTLKVSNDSLSTEEAPVLSILINDCPIIDNQITWTDPEVMRILLPAECFVQGTNEMILSEVHNNALYKIKLYPFDGVNVATINLVDQLFPDELISSAVNQLLTGVYNKISSGDPTSYFEPGNLANDLKTNLESSLVSLYSDFLNSVGNQLLYDADCNSLFNPRTDLRTIRQSYQTEFTNDFAGTFSSEFSSFGGLTALFNIEAINTATEWVSFVNNEYEGDFYNTTTGEPSGSFNSSLLLFSQSIADKHWPYILKVITDELGLSIDDESVVEINESFRAAYTEGLSSELSNNYDNLVDDFVSESEYYAGEDAINNVFTNVLSQASFFNDYFTEPAGASRVYNASRIIAGMLFTKTGSDFCRYSLLLNCSDPEEASICGDLGYCDDDFNYFTLGELAYTAVYEGVDEAASGLFNAAWTKTASAEVSCWKGPDSYEDGVDDGYFTGYSSVNDLLGWNRYTQVARIIPELIYMAAETFVDVLTSEALTSKIEGNVYAKITPDGNVQAGGPIEKLLGRTEARVNEEIGEAMRALFGAVFYPDLPINITPAGDFSTGLTGFASWADFLKAGATEIAEVGLKQYLRTQIIKLIVNTAINIGVNFCIMTFLSEIGFETAEEIRYSDGGIRTFDENKINVVSCVRMDELGCEPEDVIWVNETKTCYTEIFIREIGNLDTWLNLAFGTDECVGVEPFQECTPGSPTCQKNSLSACFKMSCEDVPSGEQLKAFQYWVGVLGDPVGFGGPFNPKIELLTVKRYDVNKIVLQAGGEDYPGEFPAID